MHSFCSEYCTATELSSSLLSGRVFAYIFRCLSRDVILLFFFFQAEDAIRFPQEPRGFGVVIKGRPLYRVKKKGALGERPERGQGRPNGGS